MKIKNFLIIFTLFMVLLCGVSAISAASDDTVDNIMSGVDGDSISVSNDEKAIGAGDENSALNAQENDDKINEQFPDEKIASSSESTIYVGSNSTIDGKGTEDDPFATLELACNHVNSGEQKDKVTVNINEGTYYIGSFLKFNTLDLNIVGNGSVTLKNLYSDSDKQQSFGLLPQQGGNFTMSNIIFDASDYNISDDYFVIGGWFTPFVNKGFDDLILFNNCKFTGYENKSTYLNMIPRSSDNDNDEFRFNYCKFGSSNEFLGTYARGANGKVSFNYCTFSIFSGGLGFTGRKVNVEVTFDSCWLGHNNGYTKTFYDMSTYSTAQYGEYGFNSCGLLNNNPSFRYAKLVVSENYLGDNTYEIMGKLMWNDGTDDNIDKLGLMTVYLSADNGNIPNTATLENGTFNVTYISDSDYHEIEVVLDGQKIKLNNKINFSLDAPTIYYEDDQNITVTFPSNVKGTVYVTVNNKTYPKYVDDQNKATVQIDDVLSKGTFDVNVSFVSDKNEHDVVYHSTYPQYYTVEEIDSVGFNTTTISVLGISSSLTVSPVTTTYNVTKDLVATLTDINGTVLNNKPVHIVVGTIDKTLNTTSDGKISVDISTLVPDSYIATISFAGDECYDEFSTTANVIINKVTPKVNISHEGDLVPGEKLIIKVEVPYATENVTIIVNGDKNTTKLVDHAANYTIDELTQGTYYVTVLYAGDDICDFVYATDSFDVVKSTTDLINELNQTVADKDAVIGELNQTVADKDAVIGELNQTVADKDAVIGELNQTVADKDAVIGELNQTVVDKDAVIGELNQTVADKDAVIGELNQTVADKDAVIGELNQTVADKDAVIGELNQTVADKDAVIGELNQTVADKDAVIGELNQTVADKDAVIGELNQTVADKDAVIGELNQTVADKDAVIGELNQTVADKDAVIGELNQNVTAKDAEITNINNDLTEKDNIIAGKEAEITTLNDNVKTMNNTIESQAKEINNLNATVIAQDKTMEKSLNPVATSILVKNIRTVATSAKYFIISLVDANNVPLANKTVKFTVNGKTKSVVTNGSGVARVKVIYNVAGTRFYTFSFLGENGYSASIASAKVVVIKKATKLAVSKKATTKTKKVQVKLTTGKTVLKYKQVILKIKGKTYTVKTNKKGIATFKIAGLIKGTFKYTVKFAGDKTYKTTSKNGRITVY